VHLKPENIAAPEKKKEIPEYRSEKSQLNNTKNFFKIFWTEKRGI
jgi:hypothetical protein